MLFKYQIFFLREKKKKKKKKGNLSFLDVEMSREGNKFITTVYRKPTFSGVYTYFHSFLQ